MRSVSAALLSAARSGHYTPALELTCGAITITQANIRRLEIHETGRLGAARFMAVLDNTDGKAQAFALAIESAPFTSSDGLTVAGMRYLVPRGTWFTQSIVTSSITTQHDTITITAQNAWHLLSAMPTIEFAYTNTPITDLLEAAFIAVGGSAVTVYDSATFNTEIDFKFPAGWPYQPRCGDLCGDGAASQSRAYGRFSADGATWYVFGGKINPTASGSIGGSNETRVLATGIGPQPCAGTVYIHGNPYAAAGSIDDLAGIISTHSVIINTRSLTTLQQVQDRLTQEIIEQIERSISGEINTSYDPRFEQWDYLAVHGTPEVADGAIMRVTETHLVYRAGYGYQQTLHVRATATNTDHNAPADLETMPAITLLIGNFYGNDDCIIQWADIDRDAYPQFLHYELTVDGTTYTTADHSFLYTSSMNRFHHSGIYDPVLTVDVCAVSIYDHRGPITSNTFANDDPYGDTIQDDFALYGGALLAAVGSEALQWIQLHDCNTINSGLELDDPGGGGVDNSIFVEGTGSIYFQSGVTFKLLTLSGVDLSAEGRFTSSDYLCFAARTNDPAGGAHITIHFEDNSAHSFNYSVPDALTVNVWKFISIQRSSLEAVAPIGFTWNSIFKVTFGNSYASNKNLYLDDIRFVKAKASDDQPWNDTGGVWKPITGQDAIWHVEQDMPKDIGIGIASAAGAPFCLAQLNSVPGERWVNLLQGNYSIAKHFMAGIIIREANGKASLFCSATDHNDGYALQLDHQLQQVHIDRFDNGVRTRLATAAFTFAVNRPVTVAIERNGQQLRAYAALGTANVLDARYLKCTANDTTYPMGKIGVISHGINCRFFRIRAGSPQHALTAEYSFSTEATGHIHSSGAAWSAATGTPTRSTFLTSTVTLSQLAERVKALIDDLQADRLIG